MAMTMLVDRHEAGRRLAAGLSHLGGEDLVVLGLPRGGVPVAYEVARALGSPLDVIVVRKLGLPFQPEVAMGAIGEGGVEVLDRDLISRARVSEATLGVVEERERRELASRAARLRRGRSRVPLRGRIALVVDDGIATGATARAACEVARSLGASRVVLAAPVAPAGMTARHLAADEFVCLLMPRGFRAVGEHYLDFAPTTDQEVAALLGVAADDGSGPRTPRLDAEVGIELGDVTLGGRWPFRPTRVRWWCSPTGAGAAGGAPATSSWPSSFATQASARCGSTC